MLFVHFRIGENGYALATHRVVEIVPLTGLRPMRHAGAPDLHIFEYRGTYIPAVDLCAIELGRPARRRLSTRIIVVRRAEGEAGLVGLVAEHATATLRVDPAAFAPFAPSPHGLLQRVEVEDLLPGPLRAALARSPEPAL